MKRVDAPKKVKKSVDTLTHEQAARFFELLPACDLDFTQEEFNAKKKQLLSL